MPKTTHRRAPAVPSSTATLIEIPAEIAEVLSRDRALDSAVGLNLEPFESWFEKCGMIFFPEFTDHGPRHVTEVLETCASIMADDAWQVFTAQDAAVLVVATLLHDCGMHLTKDGFQALLRSNPTPIPVFEGQPDKTWRLLWEEFSAEVMRFDERKLKSLGRKEPFRRLPEDQQSWDENDCKLIGEFLRRHHHRLAHDIALHGVPGPTSSPLKLIGLDPELQYYAGAVARSHGTSLRDAFRYLRRDRTLEYRGIHAPYLMALLRVSDYLQIQSKRAPASIPKLWRPRSPLSLREWKTHEAVKNITFMQSDPEAIYVDAEPAEVSTYLRINDWRHGLQHEIDLCWATLGEVYGRVDTRFGLCIRRVRSNMDDTIAFARSRNFVPCHASFDAAGVELLELLVRPLYGNQPSIGLRELIQNAVDAVRERAALKADSGRVIARESKRKAGAICVSLERGAEDEEWLVVSDCGIGMTVDVVRNYFLKVGASFRRSDAWKQMFEDDSQRSRVLKSGRFGIGVLAGFLLGSRIVVSTRHCNASEDEGIRFEASLDTDEIQLTYCRLPIGTEIRVLLHEGVGTILKNDRNENDWSSWKPWERDQTHPADWYWLENPVVSLRGLGRSKLSGSLCPGLSVKPRGGWRTIQAEDLDGVMWTYSKDVPPLLCNGILVLKKAYAHKFPRDPLAFHGDRRLTVPRFSVFDPDGVLPINLARDRIENWDWLDWDTLLEDVYRDMLAWTIANSPSASETSPLIGSAPSYPGFMGLEDYHRGVSEWAYTSEGFLLLSEGSIQAVNPSAVALVPRELTLEWQRSKILREVVARRASQDLICSLSLRWSATTWAVFEYIKDCLGLVLRPQVGSQYRTTFLDILQGRGVRGCRVILKRDIWERLVSAKRSPKWVTAAHIEPLTKDWIAARAGSVPPQRASIDTAICESCKSRPEVTIGLIELFLESPRAHNAAPSATWPWADLLETPIIPYDRRERMEHCAKALLVLRDAISQHDRARTSQAKAAQDPDAWPSSV